MNVGGFGLERFGWSYNTYPDRYLLTYAFEQLIIHLSPRLSAVIYTQLSDVETEWNGILTYDRRKMKFIPDHLTRVLRKNYSRLYQLEHIWNLTSIPYRNYTHLSFFRTFTLSFKRNPIRFYVYTCYLYSFVNITINQQYQILLNETHRRTNYHYFSLPRKLYPRSLNENYSLDIRISYQSSIDDDDEQTFLYRNRTYFDFNLAVLFE